MDYCACDADEFYDIYDSRTITARKQWTCDECGESIQPGEEYINIDHLFDGSWGHEKICQYCNHDIEILQGLGMCLERGQLEAAWKQAFGDN